MRWKLACMTVCAAFLLTILSPIVKPAAGDPPGAGDPPAPPGPGPIAGGGAGPLGPGIGGSFAPSSQTLVNGTHDGGDCGSAWTALNASDDLRCTYTEVDRSPPDELGIVLLPDGDDVVGWSASGCQTDPSGWDELDDPEIPNDGDATCRQGSTNGNRVGVTLRNPTWADPSDLDDFTVTASVDARKVASQGASITVDVKVGASAYSQGPIASTTTSYVRYNRAVATNPISGMEWTVSDIDALVVAARCEDCSPNNRATKIQATVDGYYNAEYALEVRFAWSGLPVQAEAWLLRAECSRLNPGGENVTIQVGQGGASPTVWKTAFRCTSDQDELFDPYALSTAELNGGAPVVRLWDAQPDTPDDTLRGTAALDLLRIDVDPWTEGTLNVTFAQPLNLTSAYANNTNAPYRVVTNTSYTYVTSWGNFTAPIASPHAVATYDIEDRLLASASTFVVEGSPATSVSGSYLVESSNTTHRYRYNVTTGSTLQGAMDVTALFDAAVPPKFTAVFTIDPNATLTSWHVRWKIVTPVHHLALDDSSTLFYGSLGQLQVVRTSPPDPPTAVVGPVARFPEWNTTLRVDWSDFGTGTLYAGPVTIDGNHSGQGVVVAFPPSVPVIDPSLAAYSYTSYGTAFTNQKRVFFHDGRYLAFFAHLDGTLPSIRYVLGRDLGSGMAWELPIVAVHRPRMEWGFDVDLRGGLVALAWYSTDLATLNIRAMVKIGTVAHGRISWGPEVLIYSFSSATVLSPMSVAIDEDQRVWLVVVPGNELRVLRSPVPGSNPNHAVIIMSAPSARVAARLVPLHDGNVLLLWSASADTEIRWRTCCTGFDEWSAERVTSGASLPINTWKTDRLTSTATRDFVTNKPQAKVLFIDGSPEPRLRSVLLYADGNSGFTNIDAGAAFPAIQRDSNEDLHLFWTKRPSASAPRQIRYRWESPRLGLAEPPKSPFPSAGSPFYLSTGFNATAQRTFLVYTDESSNQYAIYFAALPTHRGGSGGGGAAWDRPGISPFGTYFQQISEFIAPGTGLLTVKQTDLSAPGKGLDLAVQRLYRTPETFARGTSGLYDEPWGYDEPTLYSIGRGWSLNFPALTNAHIYLWDGQRYVIRWNGNVFENHDGEYFRLERAGPQSRDFHLFTKSGVRYRFERFPNGIGLTSILDTNGNEITFNYGTYGTQGYRRLDSITDTMGIDPGSGQPRRPIVFGYAPTPDCGGTASSPPRICSATYGGRTVMYRYAGGWDRLTSVVDPLGRTTHFQYCESACGAAVNRWLVGAVVYPTLAQTEYRYKSAQVGSDTVAFLVDVAKVKNEVRLTVRKTVHSYDVVNGAVVFSKVAHYDGESALQSFTRYEMDALLAAMTVARLTPSGARFETQRWWYGEGGRPVLQEVFKGATDPNLSGPTFAVLTTYDEVGNVVYTRDGTGGESFASYANSDRQSAFYAPGRLDPSNPPVQGRVWSDDFRDRDISDWSVGNPGHGTVELNPSVFDRLPPSLEIRTLSASDSMTASYSFPSQSSGFVATTLVRMAEDNRNHHVKLRAGPTDRIVITFGADRKIAFTGGNPATYPVYSAGRWYHLAVELTPDLQRYNLWVDGVWVSPGAFFTSGSGAINGIRFEVGPVTGKMWVNEVAVFRSTYVWINDIQQGTRIRVRSAATGELINTLLITGTSAMVALLPHRYPRVSLEILDSEWSVLFATQTRVLWGGSTWDFVEPRFLSDFTKSSSGFRRADAVWVDDATPSGSFHFNYERPPPYTSAWEWTEDATFAASGSRFHESPGRSGIHGHLFSNQSPQTQLCPGIDDFLVEYVYLRRYPSELRRGFTSATQPYFRAAWGDPELMAPGPRTKHMGAVPSLEDRWGMLIVRQRDLQDNPSGPANCWSGAVYELVGGGASWDFTTRGDALMGKIRVSGLSPGWVAEMRTKARPSGETVWATATANAQGTATLDLYGTGESFRNAFPIEAKFTIHRVEASQKIYLYESPWFPNVFGGDEFLYDSSAETDFEYNAVDEKIRDRIRGAYRIQSATPLVAQETYFRYDSAGNLLESKAQGPGGTWVTSSRTYAQGNVVSATSLYDDASSHTTGYQYDASYQSAYLTRVHDIVGSSNHYTTFEYDLSRGDLKSVTPPSLYGTGKKTSYEYDAVGRLTRVTHPDGAKVAYEYYDWERLVVEKSERHSSEFLRPNPPPGSRSEWSRSGCTANWDCVDEQPHDGYISYVYSRVHGKEDRYRLTSTQQAEVGSVTVHAVARAYPVGCVDAYECYTYFQLTVNGYASPLKWAEIAWTPVSHTWTVNPATGQPWTQAQVNSLEAGIRRVVDPWAPETEAQVTQLSVEIGTRQQTWRCYDAIGRITKVFRFDEMGPPGPPTCRVDVNYYTSEAYYSRETFVYDGMDRVVAHTAPRGPTEADRTDRRAYDAAGRVTRFTNPDGTYVDVAYTDEANTKTVSVTIDVQSPRKTQYVFDWSGRLSKVREFWGSGSADFDETEYAYDFAGNLRTATTPPDTTLVRQVTAHEYDELNRLRKTTFPDQTYEEYTYYLSGALKTKRDRAGGLTTFVYDPLRRVDVVTYPGNTESADYDYDANGNLKKLTLVQQGQAQPVVLDYTYHPDRDWLQTETLTVDAVARTVTYTHDVAGNVNRIQGPTGSSYDVHYRYDAFDRVCAVTSTAPTSCTPAAGSFHARLSYFRDDAPDTTTYGNSGTSVTTAHAYDVNGRPTSIETKQGATLYLRLAYQDYDTLANPVSVQATGQGLSTTTESYVYDSRGRLSSSTASGSWAWSLGYTYDALGNRKTVTDGASATHYRYDTYSRLCRTKVGSVPSSCADNVGTNRYVYDGGVPGRGLLTSRLVGGQSWTFDWTVGERLKSVAGPSFSASYAYDGLGRRVKSVINGVTNVYVYAGLSVIVETNPATRYVFANGLRLARIQGTTTEYYHYDHLGTVRVVTSGTGARDATLAYRPFGICAYGCASERPYAYTGEYRESAPNLVYLHSRWYDPTIGRFLSADDRLGRLSMPQDQNRYAYVVNNPMAYTDPTGRDFWSDAAKVLLIALAVVAIVLTAGAIVAVIAAYAAAASVGFAAGALATTAFTTLVTEIGAAALFAGAVALGSAIGAMAVGHDPVQAAVQGFAWTFGPAAGVAGLRYFLRAMGAVAEAESSIPAKGENAGQAAEVTKPDQLFVRGGKNPAGKLAENMPEISGSSAPGRSPKDLLASIPTKSGVPYQEGSVATVSDINRIGGAVIRRPLPGYPTHCVVVCVRGDPALFPSLLRSVLRQVTFSP